MSKREYPDSFTLRIKPEIRAALEKQAKKEDRSLSYIINRYLLKGLKESGYLSEESDEK